MLRLNSPLITGRMLPLALALGLAPVALLGQSAPAPAMTDNPLLTESTLPFNYPHFDRIKDEHYLPAFEAGMAEQRREIDAITATPGEPTFENTIVALERSGQLLGRVSRVFFNLTGTHTNPAMQKLEREIGPKLAAHGDAIRLNAALFDRIASLYERRMSLGLDEEAARVLERYYKDFVRSGAKLNEADKTYQIGRAHV